jgi:hypothetical protein
MIRLEEYDTVIKRAEEQQSCEERRSVLDGMVTSNGARVVVVESIYFATESSAY